MKSALRKELKSREHDRMELTNTTVVILFFFQLVISTKIRILMSKDSREL